MTTKRDSATRAAMLAATLAAVLCYPPCFAITAAQANSPAAQASTSSSVTAAATARLNKKPFRDVKVTVDNGIATLTGTVDQYPYKADAERRVRKVAGVTSVRDLIEVAGPAIPDQKLQSTIQEEIDNDRVFYSNYSNAFNAITVSVENGVVTLGGHAVSYFFRNSALALASSARGVKDVIDHIQVDPTSQMDDRVRLDVYRAIYDYPVFTKYAINPIKPIRISVQNGNVSLYGTVDSQADKDTALLRANSVPGVFSVKNYLQVAK